MLALRYAMTPDSPFSEESISQDTIHVSREYSELKWQIFRERQSDMREKKRIFSKPYLAHHYLEHFFELSIEQACERDRFLLTHQCVVDLLLESSEGRRWVLNEHKKIVNDPAHRARTQQIDGFIYKGGLIRWTWWKLFSKQKHHYTSGYHNRISAIAEHIEEEDTEKEQEKLEQEVEKDQTPTNIEKLDDNKIKHIIEGSKGKDHKWEKVSSRKDWKEIKKIIKEVMEMGQEKPYGRAQLRSKKIKGHVVEVTYVEIDRIRMISDGWVN